MRRSEHVAYIEDTQNLVKALEGLGLDKRLLNGSYR